MVTSTQTNQLAPAVAETEAERAYATVLDMLVKLELPPGSAIIESHLMESLGVGRTPLREALQRLECERLVSIFPRRGTFVTNIGLSDLAMITDMRESLESLAAARAAEVASAGDRERLGQFIGQTSVSRQPSNAMEGDYQVHRSVYATCQNPYLEETALKYLHLSTRIWRMFVDRLPAEEQRAIVSHDQMLAAIIAGEADEARRLASDHVRAFESALRKVV